uniref:SFRICE_016680 n=1 Tax=Spodoptera frugiperda TaxID=7108 RepID=A0A2H1X0R4_SPOFR
MEVGNSCAAFVRIRKYLRCDANLRFCVGALTPTPMCVGFNTLIFEDQSPMQKVAYLTPINVSLTDTAVVKETLCVSKTIAAECGAEYIQVSYDLQILENASRMVSAYEDDLENSLGDELVQFAELRKTVATVIDNSFTFCQKF